jgi:hypothetical protein
MEYKASLGTTSLVIMSGVIILFVTISVFTFTRILDADTNLLEKAIPVFAVLLLVMIYIFCYLYRPLNYFVYRDNITLYRPFKDVKIPISEITEIFKAAPETIKWTIRTFGNGGLFGLYGKFWNKKYGIMTWNATMTDNTIVVVTKANKKIVLTPDDISMLDEVKRRIKPPDKQYNNKVHYVLF